MTYNILDGGRDGDDLARLERIVQVIERQRPDILLLNECDRFDADGARIAFELERRFGLRGVLAPASSGHHLMLFAPHAAVRSADRVSTGFHHALLRCALAWHGTELFILGCHFDPWSPEARLREAQSVAGEVRPDRPTLVLGDLNAISPRDAGMLDPSAWPARYRTRHMRVDQGDGIDTRAVATLEAAGLHDLFVRHNPDAAGPTRPTALVAGEPRPAQRLDYAFATSSLAERTRACRVEDTPLAQRASDHLPLVVDIDL